MYDRLRKILIILLTAGLFLRIVSYIRYPIYEQFLRTYPIPIINWKNVSYWLLVSVFIIFILLSFGLFFWAIILLMTI